MAEEGTRPPGDGGGSPAASERLGALEEENVRLRRELDAARADATLAHAVLASAADHAVITTDATGRVTSWNVGARNVLGWEEAEAVGMDARLIFTPEDRDAGAPEAEMARVAAEGRAEHERWHVRKDGSRFWGSGAVARLRGDGGGHLKILRDRTAERRTEEALRESEARLREREAELARVQRIAGVGGVEVDLRDALRDGFRNKRSPEYLRLHGLPPEAAGEPHEAWVARIHPDDRGRAEAHFKAAVAGGAREYASEYRIVRPSDGAVRWIAARAEIERDGEGRPLRLVGAHIDVTALKEAEAALRESAERLRLVARATNDAIMDWDLRADRIAWSEAVRSVFGYGEDALSVPGEWWRERVHPDDGARVLGDLDRAVAGATEHWRSEYRFRRADGSFADVVDRCVILREDGGGRGRARRVVGSLLDVTARRRAEEALRASEALFRGLAETAPQIVWTSDDKDATWFSPRWYEYTGLAAPEGGLGTTWADVVHPDDLPAAVQRSSASVATGRDYEIEYRLRRADGAYRWHIARAVRVEGAGRWIGVATDVDDLKRVQDALRESEARFREFAEATDDVLWIVDAEAMRLEYLSPAYEKVWGERRDAVMADTGRWGALLHPDDRERALLGLPEVLRGGSYEQEYRIVRASDGAVRWVRDKGFAIRGPDGRVRRAVGLARDVTARKEADQRQLVLLQELAHRVKNTLALILAIAQQTGLRAADLGGFLEAFEGRVRALAAAHDLLSASGWRSTPLPALAGAALAAHREGPGDGRIRVDAADDVTLTPAAAQSLVLALHELATNATKHGALSAPGGRVALEARALGDELVLAWREAGGPRIAAPPGEAGFGTALLRQVVGYQHDGSVELDWRPEGLACTLRLPLAGVTGRVAPS